MQSSTQSTPQGFFGNKPITFQSDRAWALWGSYGVWHGFTTDWSGGSSLSSFTRGRKTAGILKIWMHGRMKGTKGFPLLWLLPNLLFPCLWMLRPVLLQNPCATLIHTTLSEWLLYTIILLLLIINFYCTMEISSYISVNN